MCAAREQEVMLSVMASLQSEQITSCWYVIILL